MPMWLEGVSRIDETGEDGEAVPHVLHDHTVPIEAEELKNWIFSGCEELFEHTMVGESFVV